jgi:hypothetical protein
MASYYDWLVMKIGGEGPYRKLLRFLYSTDFTWRNDILTDSAREEDGYELRFMYFDETRKRIDVFQDKNCSVLEMLIALSIRVDRDILWVPGESHQDWLFWIMLKNANLTLYSDDRFDENAVYNIIDNILSRKYKKNGEGGFFPVKKAFQDQRNVPIWDQMNQFLNETFFKGVR